MRVAGRFTMLATFTVSTSLRLPNKKPRGDCRGALELRRARSALAADLRTTTAALLCFPGLELLEQCLSIRIGLRAFRRSVLAHEVIEAVARRSARRSLHRMRLQPLLGGRQALPARQRRRQRHFLPLRMEGRVLQRREFGEERINEQLQL